MKYWKISIRIYYIVYIVYGARSIYIVDWTALAYAFGRFCSTVLFLPMLFDVVCGRFCST